MRHLPGGDATRQVTGEARQEGLRVERERVSPSRGDSVGLSVVASQGCGEVCQGCRDVIADRFLLRVNSRSWHQTCLRCCVCQLALDRQPSCFIREHNVYCKTDYTRRLFRDTADNKGVRGGQRRALKCGFEWGGMREVWS
ncbi:hypothetical protein O3P69_016713 [Scylla paramamosain]|uniref:LIM zinc-binding domain-containing protein n=1 Tax=Scylla paramamosain TaxID=85552 RepID=A0AAW0SXX3_SCYPA